MDLKIIFVGQHYKGGKKALDITTTSGKRVQAIQEMVWRLANERPLDFKRANLFRTTYQPKPSDYPRHIKEFFEKNPIAPNVLFVFFGSVVADALNGNAIITPQLNALWMKHPASRWSDDSLTNWIENAARAIWITLQKMEERWVRSLPPAVLSQFETDLLDLMVGNNCHLENRMTTRHIAHSGNDARPFAVLDAFGDEIQRFVKLADAVKLMNQ